MFGHFSTLLDFLSESASLVDRTFLSRIPSNPVLPPPAPSSSTPEIQTQKQSRATYQPLELRLQIFEAAQFSDRELFNIGLEGSIFQAVATLHFAHVQEIRTGAKPCLLSGPILPRVEARVSGPEAARDPGEAPPPSPKSLQEQNSSFPPFPPCFNLG